MPEHLDPEWRAVSSYLVSTRREQKQAEHRARLSANFIEYHYRVNVMLGNRDFL